MQGPSQYGVLLSHVGSGFTPSFRLSSSDRPIFVFQCPRPSPLLLLPSPLTLPYYFIELRKDKFRMSLCLLVDSYPLLHH